MAVRSVEELQEAMQKYEELSSDTEMVRVYQQLRRIKADELSMNKYIREEGKREEKIEIAKKLKEQNVAIDIIVASTGLSKEEIEKL